MLVLEDVILFVRGLYPEIVRQRKAGPGIALVPAVCYRLNLEPHIVKMEATGALIGFVAGVTLNFNRYFPVHNNCNLRKIYF